MKILAVANHKGGTAKTTTTVNLAAALGEVGYRVLVVDMDPQGAATRWLGLAPGGPAILDAYLGKVELTDVAVATTAPGVQLVPSSPWLVASERSEEIALVLGVMRTVDNLSPRWDYLLLDCPPSQGYLGIAPLAVSDMLVVPVEAHVLALAGLNDLLETVAAVQRSLNPHLALAAIIVCRVNHTRHAREVLYRLQDRFPLETFDAYVRENIALAEAPSFQLPITRYAPASSGSEDYRAVAGEFVRRQRSGMGRSSVPPAADRMAAAGQVRW